MLRLIGDRGFARVSELSEAFGVSEVTVRGDLDVLDRANAVARVHGGAVPRAELRELSFEEALESSADEKYAIAEAAVDLIEPGMSVLIDVGTTGAAVARALVSRTLGSDSRVGASALRDVTVVTNGLAIALELERAIPALQVVVTGGTLRPLQHSLVAPFASLLLEQLHVDLALIGCNGIHPEGGVTNVNLPEAELKKSMLSAATRAYVVADGSKVGQVHLGRIGGFDHFVGLITGESAEPDVLESLRQIRPVTVVSSTRA
jgi:DeoR family transcriptional regulator of aga operon